MVEYAAVSASPSMLTGGASLPSRAGGHADGGGAIKAKVGARARRGESERCACVCAGQDEADQGVERSWRAGRVRGMGLPRDHGTACSTCEAARWRSLGVALPCTAPCIICPCLNKQAVFGPCLPVIRLHILTHIMDQKRRCLASSASAACRAPLLPTSRKGVCNQSAMSTCVVKNASAHRPSCIHMLRAQVVAQRDRI